MNLNKIRPKSDTADLIISLTKNCESIIEQTHRKAEETLELKMIKPREIFHFDPAIPIEGSWMLGLTSLEMYKSIFNMTQQNNIFELYTDPFDSDFSFTELKDKVAEFVGLSDISIEDLEHEKYGPNFQKKIIENYQQKRVRLMVKKLIIKLSAFII